MWQDRPNQWDNGLTQSFRSNSLSEFINCLLSLTRWILKLQVNMWYLYTVLCPMGLHILFFFYQSFTKLSRHNDKHIIVQVNFIWVIKLYIYIYIYFFFFLQAFQLCRAENWRGHPIRWLNCKTMEVMHSTTTRRSQNPGQNFPHMVNWHIFKYSSINAREHDNPPSSNHGPSSWATFQNSNWVYGSHTHHICCHLSYSNRSLPLSLVAETEPSVSDTSWASRSRPYPKQS